VIHWQYPGAAAMSFLILFPEVHLAITFRYNDPVVAAEGFFTKVKSTFAKRTSNVEPVNSEWGDGTFTLTAWNGFQLHLNFMGDVEYAYILMLLRKFNQEIPRLCEFT
jgi:hypothetical protein